MSANSTQISDQGERESFISVYGRISRETKGKLVWAARKARMKLSDWCVMTLEGVADSMPEIQEEDWYDNRGNR
jgi:hypothetical protein